MVRISKTVWASGVMVSAMGFATLASGTAWAAGCAEGCVDTVVVGENGCFCPTGNDGGLVKLVVSVLDIMTAGIGVLAVVGVMYAGIQYMMAGENEQKVMAAKRRLGWVTTGLVAYVLVFVIMKWLLPGFAGNGGSTGNQGVADDPTAEVETLGVPEEGNDLPGPEEGSEKLPEDGGDGAKGEGEIIDVREWVLTET